MWGRGCEREPQCPRKAGADTRRRPPNFTSDGRPGRARPVVLVHRAEHVDQRPRVATDQTHPRAGSPVHVHAVDLAPGVLMRLVRDDTGALVYVFSTMNQHDGECSA